MKYRILLDAFTSRRDVAANYVFAKILEKKGCKCKVACCRNFSRHLRLWRPDAVVVSVPSRLDIIKKICPDAEIIFFPGEGGEPREHLYENSYFKDEKLKEYDYISMYLLWGKYNQSLADEVFPEYKNMRKLVGNLRFDLPKYSPLIAKDKSKLNTIGIIGRFTSINNFSGKPTVTTLFNTSETVFNSVINQCKQLHAIVKLIDYIIENTSFNVSIRPHPLEAPEGYQMLVEKYPKGRLQIDDSFNYSGWLCSQKMIFAPASTSFLEAYLLKVPMVNIDHALGIAENIRETSPFAALSHKCSYQPDNIEELYELIKNPPEPICNIPEIDEHLQEVHSWDPTSSVLVKAADEIINFLKEKRKPKFFRKPSFITELADWYYFTKATYWGSRLHPNFNYKSGYHKIPAYYDELVDNIINNRPQID